MMRPSPDSAAPPWTITVTGLGAVSLPPDSAVIVLEVQITAPSAREATARVAATMEAVRAALRARHLSNRDLRTSNFRVAPRHQPSPDGKVRFAGYQASHQLHISLAQPEQAGEVLDEALAAGGNNLLVQQVEFVARTIGAARDDAQRAALADARRQAEVLADAAGLTLGMPMTIRQTPPQMQRGPVRFYAAERVRGAATELEQGELDINVSLEVVFLTSAAAPAEPGG